MTTERPKSASLISVAESIRSIGFGEQNSILRQNSSVRNTFRILSEQSKPIRDTITVVLYCSAHDRVLLAKFKTGEIYFPYYAILPGEAPSESVVLVVERILKSFPKYFPTPKNIKLARLVRYPISDANRHMITHYTYFACITHAQKFEDIPDPALVKRGPMLSLPNGTFWNSEFEVSYAWTQFTDFANMRNSFWGPEVQEQAHQIRMNSMRLKDLNLEVIDYCLSSIEQLYTECAGPLYGVKDVRAFIRHSRIDQQILTGLWNEWVFHCSPSIAMCYLSFKRFLHKLDIVPKNVSKREIEEFDKIGRRLYHAFISTADNLRSLCRNMISRKGSSSDVEVTDFRQVQAKSTMPQLDFLSLALGLAILDSGTTSYIFWDVHMLFSFMYNSFKEGQTNMEEDCLTLSKLKDMIYETPDILNCAFVNKITQDNSRSECLGRMKPSIDDCAAILMRVIGRMGTVNEHSSLKLNDFRFMHDTGETEEVIDLMWLLARTHFRPDEDGQILRRVQTQMMIRHNPGNPGKASDSGNDDDMARNLSGDESIKLARMIVTQNIERDRCEECSLVDYKISSKVTTMNRSGYPIDFEPVDYPGIDHQTSLTSSEFPHLFLAPNTNARLNIGEMFENVMTRKEDIKQLFRAVKGILSRQNDLIQSVETPAVVIGEVRGNHLFLASICESICPLFTCMTSTNFITCGNYFDDDAGLEALVFLLSAKAHSPERIILLKGPNDNRENIREMNVYKKGVEAFDNETWGLLLDCLDLLPYAAIIKDKIFVSKSGVPISSRKLSYITEFRREAPYPKKDSLLFTQILSGQIVRSKSNNKKGKKSKLESKASIVKGKSEEVSKNKSQASAINKSNGPPEITVEELESFLKKNNLSHFVRSDSFAPEENVKCYKVELGCQMITLGSLQAHKASNSDTGRVNGAFLMISKSSLQLIKLSETIKQNPNEGSQKGFLNTK